MTSDLTSKHCRELLTGIKSASLPQIKSLSTRIKDHKASFTTVEYSYLMLSISERLLQIAKPQFNSRNIVHFSSATETISA